MLLQMSAMSVGGSELVSSSGQSTVGWTPGVTEPVSSSGQSTVGWTPGVTEPVSSSGQSTVGWTPGVTDWLTHRCRPVGRTGVCYCTFSLTVFTVLC